VYDRFVRWRSNWRRWHRLFFPSAAEVKFVRVMRGRALTAPIIKSRKTGYPLTLLWRGRLLRNELIEREVRVGSKFVDFGTPGAAYHKAIEIDSDQFHTYKMDVVADQERDNYLREHGWQVTRIPARRLYREPRRVYVEMLRFLKS
jgi:very-short-patch-repair endonuclease